MHGKTCAGLWVTGTGKGGNPRVHLPVPRRRQRWSIDEYSHQCGVWQTAINPVGALELLANGTWSGSGILGPEAFDSVPFLELLTSYGSPWGQQELATAD
jgi:saccharopine dehydrogenase (NAD+, L-lysine-forming)